MLKYLKSKTQPQPTAMRSKEECLQKISDIVERGKISITQLNQFVSLIEDESKLQTALMFLK